jgi:hypothetical protein
VAGADDALFEFIKLMWPDANPRLCNALHALMTKGSSVAYCGSAAKKGADAQ